MRDLNMLELGMEADETNSITILQCQSCGTETEDEDELCCEDPNIHSINIDEDGEELYGEF